jgi:hypothetical protein
MAKLTEAEVEAEAHRIVLAMLASVRGEPRGPLLAAVAFVLVDVARDSGATKEEALYLVAKMWERHVSLDAAVAAVSPS